MSMPRQPYWTAGEESTPVAVRVLGNLYVRLLGRPAFRTWNHHLLTLALHGLGCGDRWAGEDLFLMRLARLGQVTVFDVGANEGNYARRVRALNPEARIWSFEPHPSTFRRLRAAAEANGFVAVNKALGDQSGRARLYDRGQWGDTGSPYASLVPQVIEAIYQEPASAVDVEVTTIDGFLEAGGVERINLLKIDAEGHELAILRGATRALSRGMVDAVQFEFNAMNVASRVFFKDFYDALPGFRFYRMGGGGLIPMGDYLARTHEFFVIQNVVAVREGAGKSLALAGSPARAAG